MIDKKNVKNDFVRMILESLGIMDLKQAKFGGKT